MRIFPDSALARSALLIGLALVLSQLAMTALLRQLVVGPAAEQMASLLADNLGLVETLLGGASADARAALLARLDLSQDLHLSLVPGGPPGGEPVLFYQRTIGRLLARRLGPRAQYRVQMDGETILWARPGPDAPYWLGMSARRLEQGVPGVLLWWVLLLVAISAGGGLVLARHLNRHLQRLAALAARVGRGELPDRFGAGGPREVRALAQALERMAGDLRQAAEDRGLLLAGISHDLRTPLARIRLSLEMLGDADEDIRAGIAEDIEEMDAIVGAFIATIRDGHDEAAVPRDLNADIRALCARIARVRTPPCLDLAPLPTVALRPMAMGRLLANLLENAHRHGGEPVEIRTRALAGCLRVQVLDRGPGIPEAELAGLFKPFSRGRGRGGGSGLGLVVARRIARLHGGELALHNRPGGGIEARLDLPLPL